MTKNTHQKNQKVGFFDDIYNYFRDFSFLFGLLICAGFIMTRRILTESKASKIHLQSKSFLYTALLHIVFIFLSSIISLKLTDYFYKSFFILLTFWISGSFLALVVYGFFSSHKDKNRITTTNLNDQTLDFKDLYEKINDPNNIPIGKSLINNKPILLPIHLVREHSLNSGATGQGKTTQLITKVSHYILHNRPVIIIDPKGQRSDVEQIRAIARACGKENDFKLFSLSFPGESCSYNPVKVGTPVQQKDKLLSGLELHHEYYGSKANEFLGVIFDAFQYLKLEINIAKIHQILINKSEFSKFENLLRDQKESKDLEKLLSQVHSIRQIADKDLSGLVAQLGTLNSFELGPLLISDESREEIDLVNVLNKNQIAYFQLNVNGYQKIAKQIGKLIVQDLRLVSNLFQSEMVEKKFDNAICFIDEFGSFATKDFADFLKMARSSGIGCDLSFQGIADLRAVSPEFADQIIGNTVFKTIFRQDLSEEVETWSSMAGTEDYEIESKQLENDVLLGKKSTGMGNSHIGKRMLIEFDVFKKLKRGQSILINKAMHTHDLVSVWNFDIQYFMKSLVKISQPESEKNNNKQLKNSNIIKRKLNLENIKQADANL